jgi:hypothetical protein
MGDTQGTALNTGAIKFKDTGFGKFLTEKLPEVASQIGDLLPNQGVLGLVKNIITDPNQSPNLTDVDRLALLNAANQFKLNLDQDDTEKIKSYNDVEKAQVSSDDNYTRRARPTLQYATMLFLFLCYPVAWFFKGEFIHLPDTLLIILGSILGVYTVARSMEKTAAINAASPNPVNGSPLAKTLNALVGKK